MKHIIFANIYIVWLSEEIILCHSSKCTCDVLQVIQYFCSSFHQLSQQLLPLWPDLTQTHHLHSLLVPDDIVCIYVLAYAWIYCHVATIKQTNFEAIPFCGSSKFSKIFVDFTLHTPKHMQYTVNDEKLEGLNFGEFGKLSVFAKLYSPIAQITLIHTFNSGWICHIFFRQTGLLADSPNFSPSNFWLFAVY